jgi:hypothetical protein
VARKRFSNNELVTIAVHNLGGDSRAVDTEDVAIEVNRLAPGRFTWQKYKDQINIEYVRVRLSDAKKSSKGAYLVGSSIEGWMLTPAGLSFVEAVGDVFVAEGGASRRPPSKDEKWLASERERLLSTDAYAKFTEGRIDDVTSRDVARFFRLDEYVTGSARERKITRLMNGFGKDPDLKHAIEIFQTILREGKQK